MRPAGPKTWLLNGAVGWRIGVPAGSFPEGLRLAPEPGGPAALASADGSMGGLVLPRRVATDRRGLPYLLDAGVPAWNPESRRFERWPGLGAEGSGPREFRGAANLAIAGQRLAVADTGNARVSIFDLRTTALLALLPIPAVDVAAWQERFVALTADGAVWAESRRLFHAGPPRSAWSRIACDLAGRIYLLDGETLAVFENRAGVWRRQATVLDPAEIRHRFATPAVTGIATAAGEIHIVLPEALVRQGLEPKPRGEYEVQLGSLVYVLDRKRRTVSAWDSDRQVVRHRFDLSDWDPADLTVAGDVVYVLDRRHNRALVHRPGSESLQTLFTAPRNRPAGEVWDRIAVEADNCIAIRAGSGVAFRYSPAGELIATLTGADPRPHFPDRTPALASDPLRAGPTRFRLDGSEVAPSDGLEARPRSYAPAATFVLGPLDSEIHDCPWHRIELTLDDLPPGTSVEVRTRTASEVNPLPQPQSQVAFRTAGELQPAPAGGAQRIVKDFLVPSGPGRFLWLEIDLGGDGFRTPSVGELRLHYPRESYLSFLPGVFSFDDESRRFLESFLAVFQTEFERMETSLREVEKHFDPQAVPDGPFLRNLAERWLGLDLEQSWTPRQQREVVTAAPGAMSKRGTPEGFRTVIASYLAALSGLPRQEVEALGFPRLVEGFAEREFLQLGGSGSLWDSRRVPRFQLGVASREGEYELLSEGSPATDPFAYYAHRFRVYLPAAWIGNADDERALRRAIEREKPAHTAYQLLLIEPGLQAGVQSTVGFDTILGAPPEAHLDQAGHADHPPAAPPSGRLGQDTVLAGAEGAPMQLTPGVVIGRDSQLA